MFRICRIITGTKEECDNLKQYLGGYPVEITQEVPEENYYDIPTLMVGWNNVKNRFPNQRIDNKEVTNNLSWTYNEKEVEELLDKTNFNSEIDSFVNKNLYNWLPNNYSLFDPLFHGNLSKFREQYIDDSIVSYVHFNDGAIYIRNGENNFVINIKSLHYVSDNYRNEVSDFLTNLNCLLYSYNKIEDYANLDTMGTVRSLDIIRWIKYGVETPIKYFQIIPNTDISKYVPFLMSKIPLDTLELTAEEELYLERMSFRDKVTRWMSTRYVSFSYDFNKNLRFLYRAGAKLAKINYSNKRTITGRITSNDNYNPQNLAKEGKPRSFIISRYRGGQVYQFDYTSFETRIALYLCGDEDFIMQYYDKDLHHETAVRIFNTFDCTSEQRDVAKLVNHSIIYGASEATIMSKMEGHVDDPQEKMLEVKRFLYPLFKRSKEIMEETEERGYIINKWNSIIRPEKSYAGFNNYIQSTASEIIVDQVYAIKNMLVGMRSQFMFQVHDSIILDIHPDEIHLVKNIIESMSYNRGMLFTVNYKSGPNYRDLSSESVYF